MSLLTFGFVYHLCTMVKEILDPLIPLSVMYGISPSP
jgi:hypothetical protein